MKIYNSNSVYQLHESICTLLWTFSQEILISQKDQDLYKNTKSQIYHLYPSFSTSASTVLGDTLSACCSATSLAQYDTNTSGNSSKYRRLVLVMFNDASNTKTICQLTI